MQGCVQHFLPFSGIFCKRFHSRLYKCNSIFTVPFANVVRKQAVCRCSPFCENAVAALRRARQPRNINLISADDAQSKAERILNRSTLKEKGLLRKKRNSPFKIHSWGIMASNHPISSAAICSSRVSGCHAGCAGSGGSACSGAQRLSSVSGAGCSGAAKSEAKRS